MKTMTIEELATEQGVFKELKSAIMRDEFNNTLDEDWAHTSNHFEAQIFKGFTKEQKEVYALATAENFADKAMVLNVYDFENVFGDYYSDILDIWNLF